MKELTEPEMLQRAAAYCSSSEHCIQEVRKKIGAAGLPDEAADRIIDRLVQEGFIDEERFSHAFVNDKLRFNHWGRVKIGYELQMRGIPSSTYQPALAAIEEEEYENILLQLLKNKMPSVKAKDERDFVLKLMRFAAGRGFESQVTNRCLKRLFEETNEDEVEATLD